MDTSASLLEMLRDAPAEGVWRRMIELYAPLIRGWLRRMGAPEDDLEDVAQDVLSVVLRRISEFQRQPRTGSFRAWLRAIAANCLREHWKSLRRQPRATGGSDVEAWLQQLEDPHSELSRQWDREHDRYLLRYLLSQLRSEFAATSWAAFERFALAGRPAEEVATELGCTTNAVFIAKSRIMTRLRQLGQGMLD